MIHPIRNWLSRHQNPVSFWLHMVGIPATIVAIPLAIQKYYLVAAALFVAGYALQFLGHAIEGNRSGEEMLVRRLLRLDTADADAQKDEKSIRRRQRPR